MCAQLVVLQCVCELSENSTVDDRQIALTIIELEGGLFDEFGDEQTCEDFVSTQREILGQFCTFLICVNLFGSFTRHWECMIHTHVIVIGFQDCCDAHRQVVAEFLEGDNARELAHFTPKFVHLCV